MTKRIRLKAKNKVNKINLQTQLMDTKDTLNNISNKKSNYYKQRADIVVSNKAQFYCIPKDYSGYIYIDFELDDYEMIYDYPNVTFLVYNKNIIIRNTAVEAFGNSCIHTFDDSVVRLYDDSICNIYNSGKNIECIGFNNSTIKINGNNDSIIKAYGNTRVINYSNNKNILLNDDAYLIK